MFTDLEFLKVGKQWTPKNATYQKRQENYVNGRLMYEGDLEAVFGDAWRAIASRYGLSYTEIQQVMVKVNLFKALTETFKILAFTTEPEVWIGEGDKAQKLEKDIYNPNLLLEKLKQAFVSCHVQGNSVLKVYSSSKGEPDISVVNAENWIPIKDPENLNEIQAHVVADTYEVDNSTSIMGINVDSKKKYLSVEVHKRGSYDKILFE